MLAVVFVSGPPSTAHACASKALEKLRCVHRECLIVPGVSIGRPPEPIATLWCFWHAPTLQLDKQLAMMSALDGVQLVRGRRNGCTLARC